MISGYIERRCHVENLLRLWFVMEGHKNGTAAENGAQKRDTHSVGHCPSKRTALGSGLGSRYTFDLRQAKEPQPVGLFGETSQKGM